LVQVIDDFTRQFSAFQSLTPAKIPPKVPTHTEIGIFFGLASVCFAGLVSKIYEKLIDRALRVVLLLIWEQNKLRSETLAAQ
jgi:hypothetical protein